MDGYDPNSSSKKNIKGCWAVTTTFVFYDVKEKQPYMVRTGLFSSGPGKGWNDKEDHAEVIDKLFSDSRDLTVHDGLPRSHHLPSLYHGGAHARFYFSPDFVFIMDNPERRGNFGMLGGNLKNHEFLDTTFPLSHWRKGSIRVTCVMRLWSNIHQPKYGRPISQNLTTVSATDSP
jgi:hypothetical protein